MKKLIIGVVGIMVLITFGCSTTKTIPPEQTPKPATNETALQWFERGNAYVQFGNYEDAVNDFTQAIASDPNFSDAYYSRGHVLGRLGKHAQAIDDFTKALSLNPKNANAYADRGTASSIGRNLHSRTAHQTSRERYLSTSSFTFFQHGTADNLLRFILPAGPMFSLQCDPRWLRI